MKERHIILFILVLFVQCAGRKEKLRQITVAEFTEFVAATAYVTDAEQYGWSIVQLDVHNFKVVNGIDWRCPSGILPAPSDHPVTQVSYNDALAYAKWSNTRLPTYDQYWALVESDKRKINAHAPQILPADQANIVGNTWDITSSDPQGRIRLAGGSYLCNAYQCNGTSRERTLHVDKETGNSHISFSVIN